MFGVSRLACIAAALLLSLLYVDEASARRCRRARCNPCCKADASCCTRVDNYTCYLTKVFELEQGSYLYEAEYHEGGCQEEPPAVYAVGDYGDNPNQDCEELECILDSKCKTYRDDHIPHYTKEVFRGFDAPLDPKFPTQWAADVTQVAERYENFDFKGEGRVYKARVFDLRLNHSGKRIYVAFEIESFPDGENPVTIPLSANKVKRCVGMHAYSVKYRGRSMLFLVDREGR